MMLCVTVRVESIGCVSCGCVTLPLVTLLVLQIEKLIFSFAQPRPYNAWPLSGGDECSADTAASVPLCCWSSFPIEHRLPVITTDWECFRFLKPGFSDPLDAN